MTENLRDQEIKAIRDGNAGAFQRVFDACYESLCEYAFTILRDSDESEDIVQTMFIKLWERRGDLDIKHSIKSYMFRAVYNQCINQLEHKTVKKKHYDRTQFNLSGTIQHPEVFIDELDDKIRETVELLPPQCRTIFIMSRYEELRYAEIAERLNISVNTIQNQVCKALKILRVELRDFI
ncbi:MAG: RNA polymerase sigma-70 factor [Chryseolinea sp.]